MLALSNSAMVKDLRTEDDPRWSAVMARDARADGHFVFGVLTTGIYCRPSCAARRPNAGNVRFYASPAEAERAGLRACRRCRPDGALLEADRTAALAAACRAIEAAEVPPPLESLARQAGLSPSYFHRLFKAVMGVTPRAYAAAHRAKRLRAALAEPGSITDASYAAGFNSSGRFYAAIDGMLGMTPQKYRAGGAQQVIRYAVTSCDLGFVLVAVTARGLCAITLGDEPPGLVSDLQQRFPRATLIGDDTGFEHWVAAVVGLVETPKRGLDLPLDIAGTAFQQQVWEALRAIPPGRTASYTDVAETIGQPRAVRAVAQACASNPLAIAVPCHRVVRQDGSLSGYRWGLDRKRKLLEREAQG